MRKLLLIGSLALASLLYAEDITKENTSEQLEKIIESDVKPNLEKPKKQNIDDLLDKAKRELKKKNKEAYIYSATATVDANPDDAQYYEYLSMAYREAFLTLKADMILSKAGKIAVEEALSYHRKQMPDDMLNDEMQKKVKKELEEKSGDADGIFAVVGNIINSIVTNAKGDKKPETIEAEVEENIFNNAYMSGFTKEAFDEIKGMIPYETFIVTNENGETEIGVLAYTTPKSLQLARDLAQGHKSKPIENKAQCKSADSIVEDFDDEYLLTHLGIKYFYNENCRPALLAYGMDSFIKEEGFNSDYRREARTRAQGNAEATIAQFLSSNVNAFMKNTELKQKTKNAMLKASKTDGKVKMGAAQKKTRTSIVKEMSKEFSSTAQASLRGMEVARTWSVDKGDYEVVGAIVYYSMDSIDEANKRFDAMENIPTQQSGKSGVKATPGVKRATNLEVDDF